MMISRTAAQNAVSPRRMVARHEPDAAHWYQDGIIYQVYLRAFCDSNRDGIGDLPGLIERLDYIQDLGVTAIWLLPFFPSPLRDDGYDVSDYKNVHPDYGSLRDFKRLLRAARERNLKVIIDLVMNHTSDEHEWFQRARSAKAGSRWRDYYVWSDDPQRYADARVIFRDFEKSNWTWDPLARAYYWHRFYAHQPDLNFENPEVREAMFDIVDFWLKLGVDGLALDAVAYLYEGEGTTCENLPPTHQFLQELRHRVDAKYPQRILLAGANQWPEDAVAYFGEGNECHLSCHFPLMARLFIAIQREDRYPILDILQQTPHLPPNCQWATFLRNHDDLTLEVVTDEERDYMYRTYAEDPQARINLGIRRRLAPLLKNDRRKIELMNSLLFSLPGAPVIYYGDEIGMGDNIYLGDRAAVRTPMHWSADRNAGFSSGASQRLYLPTVTDNEFHYAAVNVETERATPHSLLWWMRRSIAMRRLNRVLSRGTFEPLEPDNSKVLAFIRRFEDQVVLVVANLSRFLQSVELDLRGLAGREPVELFGQTRLPPIETRPYFLSIAPYAFYWFSLESPAELTREFTAPARAIRLTADWQEVFSGSPQARLETALRKYLLRHRWFGGKSRVIQSIEIQDALAIAQTGIRLAFVHVEYTEGDPEDYLLPLAFAQGRAAEARLHDTGNEAVAQVEFVGGSEPGVIYEAVGEPVFWAELLRAVAEEQAFRGEAGTAQALQTVAFRQVAQAAPLQELSIHGGQQSNTSAIFSRRVIVKLFRRVSPGVNPDYEIGRFLTEKAALPHVPRVLGALQYDRGGEPITLVIVHEFKANQGDAWEFTLDELKRYRERIAARDPASADVPRASLLTLAEHEAEVLAREVIGDFLAASKLLGRRTAELHLALASDTRDPAFAPEAMTPFYQRSMYQALQSQIKQTFRFLRKKAMQLPAAMQTAAQQVLRVEGQLLDSLRLLTSRKIQALRTRTHGDFHLGQVLYTGRDFLIIDFEGEPDRPLAERKIKVSPLRDVAGMLRSLHYASHAALNLASTDPVHDKEARRLQAWMSYWYVWTGAAFLQGYLATAKKSTILPATTEELSLLLNAYLLQKCVYELRYELNNRPDWAGIPLQGILHVTETASRGR